MRTDGGEYVLQYARDGVSATLLVAKTNTVASYSFGSLLQTYPPTTL